MHIIRIGDPCVTTNGIYVRMTLKILRNLIKCTEFDCIIGVEIVINIAGRVSEALVQTVGRSEEHTSELQSLMRISYAVFCLKQKNKLNKQMSAPTTTKK